MLVSLNKTADSRVDLAAVVTKIAKVIPGMWMNGVFPGVRTNTVHIPLLSAFGLCPAYTVNDC